ncbi:MAG: aspartate aminotransferase family protein [Robiginitomaculum sp.]|nr:aspartate aminotransferase family protein [Robiginitomaculum sp.]
MSTMTQQTLELLAQSCDLSGRYIQSLEKRNVFPSNEALQKLADLDEPAPISGECASQTLALLDRIGSPATVASTGGRYFGFVTGGVLPVALAANWIASTWDQNAALNVMSPISSKLEKVAANWLKSMLNLPTQSQVSFVTGATMASFTAIGAARTNILSRQGWDLAERGLFGAPKIRIIVSAETHVTIFKALAMLGFGKQQIETVAVDRQGRMRIEQLPQLDENCLVICQAGNVNSGSFDDVPGIIAKANGAWVHVDGAFGIWARLVPELRHLTNAIEKADSWTLDAHKWLNTPYDCGVAIIKDKAALQQSLNISAAYLATDAAGDAKDFVPEFSRRARGIEVWAALRNLGTEGIAKLVQKNCLQAQTFAAGLQKIGYKVLNEIVLNQVVASIGSKQQMQEISKLIEQGGTCWFGSTNWQGQDAFRISFCNWSTSQDDIEKSLASIAAATTKIIDG